MTRSLSPAVRLVLGDRLGQLALALLVIEVGILGVSTLRRAEPETGLENLIYPLLIAVTIVALLRGRVRLVAREKAFWDLFAAAWACLLLVEALFFFGFEFPVLTASFLADALHILFYLILSLAIDSRPHAGHLDSVSATGRRLESLSGSLVVFGFLIYFGIEVLPEPLGLSLSFASRDRGLAPFLLVRLSLDLLIMSRLGYAWLSTKGRWRWIYSWLVVSLLCLAVKDALAIGEIGGAISLGVLGFPYQVFLLVPYLLVILAARYAHLTAADSEESTATDERSEAEEPHSSPLALYILAVPGMHLLLSPLGVLEPASRAPREIFCLFYLVVLGAIAWAYQTRVARDAANSRQAVRDAKVRLQESERLESIGRLAGGIAHDFNNYLTVIQGYSELVHSTVDDTAARSQIALIRKAADSAGALTSQLLAFGRRQLLRPEPLDLNEVVKRAGSMLASLIGENIELELDLEPGVGLVAADLGQTEQVIINLALNGRDAMPDGGRLVVRTRRVTLGEDEAEGAGVAPGRYVKLEVSDGGAGMPEEVRAQVFDPFFTTKALGRGTGLGLSTVYGIVMQSGGSIEVDSELGSGTTVRVLLPGARSRQTDKPLAESRPQPNVGGETILLVEDDSTVRLLADRSLESEGFRVLSACDGEEALKIAAQHEGEIDLLVSDVMMPGIDGLELAGRIRSRHRELRVLFVSGYPLAVLRERHAEMPPSAPFLHKPFTASALVSEVRRTLQDEPR